MCAGGDAALFRAAESVEDSADAARKDFAEAVLAAGGDGLREAVVIGVSCGFSARYVATFLDAAMDDARRRFHAVALGFNPIRHASVTAFKDCLRRMRREDLSPIARGARRIVVNPRVGPEAVAGSSRLKGGAATKSILDAAFAAAIAAHARCDPPAGTAPPNPPPAYRGQPVSPPPALPSPHATSALKTLVEEALGAFAASNYAVSEALAFGPARKSAAKAAEAVAEALSSSAARERGSVHYVGADRGPREPISGLALIGAIDASEQTPTFGADPGRFNAWGGDGAAGMARREKCLRIECGVDLSLDAFERGPRRRARERTRARPDGPNPNLPSAARRWRSHHRRLSGIPRRLRRAPTREVRGEADAAFAARRRRPGAALVRVASGATRRTRRPPPRRPPPVQAVKADAESDGSEVRDPNGRKPLDPDPRVVPPPVDVFVDACGSARRSRRADPARFFHPPAIPSEGEVDSDGLAPSRALLRALLYPRLAESGAKVILNALSTAAHALVGKTHAGRMIDLRVSNAKLWRRAVGVVAEAAGTTEALAESALRGPSAATAPRGTRTTAR